MTEIKSSLYTIAITAISAGILDIFSQSGKLKKYVKYIISLIIVISLLLPIGNIISSIPDNAEPPDIQPEHENTIDTNIENTFVLALKNSIHSRFSIPSEAIDIKIGTEKNNKEIYINKISVIIKDKTYFCFSERINVFLKSITDCEIEVIQDIKE